MITARTLFLVLAGVLFFLALGVDLWTWFDGEHFGAFLAAGLIAVVLAELVPPLVAESRATRDRRTA